jgi:NADPH2:quinone reductase
MKAIVVRAFGEPEVLRVEEVPAPKPGAGQVLIAVKAIGVNPVEVYVRAGAYPRKPELPYTPGTDAAGIVTELGKGAKGFKIGDRVYIYGAVAGTYAADAVVETSRAFSLPKSLSFEQGAALGVPYGTAHRALFHFAVAQKGEVAFIHGASGGVGVAAVQLARAAGLTVIGTGGGPDGAAFVKSIGAHHALDHRAPGYQEQVLKITGGKGANVIVEMLANVNLPADLALAAAGGRIVVVGSRGAVSIDPRAAMSKDASILGMSLWNMIDADRKKVHASLAKGLKSGVLKPLIAKSFPLSDAALAHEAVMVSGARGKIVLIP